MVGFGPRRLNGWGGKRRVGLEMVTNNLTALLSRQEWRGANEQKKMVGLTVFFPPYASSWLLSGSGLSLVLCREEASRTIWLRWVDDLDPSTKISR